MTRTTLSLKLPARFALALVIAFGGLGLTVKPAAATTPPPCETTECPSAGPKAWTALTKAVVAALAVMEEDVYLNMLYVKDALARLANQHSNTRQNTLKALTNVNDKNLGDRLSADVGTVRAAALPNALPSRTACGVEARRSTTFAATALTRAAVGPAETINTGILTNAAGTPGATGQLGYVSARFQNRMGKYCDNGTVSAPAGVTCTATIGANRDLFPYDSIFKQGTFASANDYTAAKDVVLNMLGDAVKDPVRGNALSRQEGQSSSLRLYGEQAQMNLAASVMMAAVERRRDLGGSGSEQAKQSDASYSSAALAKLAEIGSGQSSAQNMDAVSAMIGETTRGIFQLRDYMEQWAAIKAVSLAIDIKQNSSAGASVSSRPIGN